MVEQREWIASQGWRLILVHMGEKKVPPSLANLPLKDVDHLHDPEGKLYAAFDLGKGNLRQLMGPAVWWRGLRAVLKGHKPGKIQSDVRQMPGAFLVYRGVIVSAWRARQVGDLPDLKAMAAVFQEHNEKLS